LLRVVLGYALCTGHVILLMRSEFSNLQNWTNTVIHIAVLWLARKLHNNLVVIKEEFINPSKFIVLHLIQVNVSKMN